MLMIKTSYLLLLTRNNCEHNQYLMHVKFSFINQNY